MNKCGICGGQTVPFETSEGTFQECSLCKTRSRLDGSLGYIEKPHSEKKYPEIILGYKIREKINQLAEIDKKILTGDSNSEVYTKNLLQLHLLSEEYIEKRGLSDSLEKERSILMSSL